MENEIPDYDDLYPPEDNVDEQNNGNAQKNGDAAKK